MNCTFMGLRMRRSCNNSKFEQERISGQMGCTVTNKGVDSWPFRLTNLLV